MENPRPSGTQRDARNVDLERLRHSTFLMAPYAHLSHLFGRPYLSYLLQVGCSVKKLQVHPNSPPSRPLRLDVGCSADPVDRDGRSALNFAAEAGHFAMDARLGRLEGGRLGVCGRPTSERSGRVPGIEEVRTDFKFTCTVNVPQM